MNNKKEIDGELAQALDCLAHVWDNHFGPFVTDSTDWKPAEKLLTKYNLIRKGIEYADINELIRISDDDYPYEVIK